MKLKKQRASSAASTLTLPPPPRTKMISLLPSPVAVFRSPEAVKRTVLMPLLPPSPPTVEVAFHLGWHSWPFLSASLPPFPPSAPARWPQEGGGE